MEKIKIYISGPVTIDKDNYEKRFQEAEDWINSQIVRIDTEDNKKLAFRIFEAVNPMKYEDVDLHGKDPWDFESWKEYLKKDIDLISQCQAIGLLDGWERSPGCVVELVTAIKYGLKIYHLDLPSEYDPEKSAEYDDSQNNFGDATLREDLLFKLLFDRLCGCKSNNDRLLINERFRDSLQEIAMQYAKASESDESMRKEAEKLASEYHNSKEA